MENKQMTIYEIVADKSWKKFMKYLEIFSAIFVVAGIFLLMAKLHLHGMFLTLGGSTLIVIYFFEGYKKLDSASKLWSALFFKIYGWGLAVSWIFILFTLQHWPLSKMVFFFMSLLAVLTSIIVGIRMKKQQEYPEINRLYFIRLLVTLGLIVYLYIEFMV